MTDHVLQYFNYYLLGFMVLITVLGSVATEIKSARKEKFLKELDPWLVKKRDLMRKLEEIADNKNISGSEETKRLGIIMRDLAIIESKITEIERA